MLNLLNSIWQWLKNISPDTVRFICLILIIWVFGHYTLNGVRIAIKDNNTKEQEMKIKRELYTIDITPKINLHIKDILSKDENASNVLLLNYHNTLVSSNGLSYRYLTALCEQFLGSNSKPTIDFWKELDYMNYGEEILKINVLGALLMDSIESFKELFPKFTYILGRSEFKSAVFYPIVGVESYIGMIIVGYKDRKPDLNATYARKIISPNILPLATLLDYDYIMKNANK